MECSEGTTFRFTHNENGSQNTPITCGNGFLLLQGRERSSYGLINARMQCIGGGTSHANSDYNGQWNDELSCNSGYVITGLEVRDQGGYGLVNVKILCGLYTMPGVLSLSLRDAFFVEYLPLIIRHQ